MTWLVDCGGSGTALGDLAVQGAVTLLWGVRALMRSGGADVAGQHLWVTTCYPGHVAQHVGYLWACVCPCTCFVLCAGYFLGLPQPYFSYATPC